MTKHVRKSRRRQAVERPPAATVRIPLPVLGAFARIERSYFELCIRADQQVQRPSQPSMLTGSREVTNDRTGHVPCP